jgi:acyl-CoA thioester hydrolase
MDASKIDADLFYHVTPIQARFSDANSAGHVNNVAILSYFETARVEFLDKVIGRENDWERTGLIIARSVMDYIEPLNIRENIRACSRISQIGTKSFTVEHLLLGERSGKEIITALGSFVLVCFDYNKNQTIEIPEVWKTRLKG